MMLKSADLLANDLFNYQHCSRWSLIEFACNTVVPILLVSQRRLITLNAANCIMLDLHHPWDTSLFFVMFFKEFESRQPQELPPQYRVNISKTPYICISGTKSCIVRVVSFINSHHARLIRVSSVITIAVTCHLLWHLQSNCWHIVWECWKTPPPPLSSRHKLDAVQWYSGV